MATYERLVDNLLEEYKKIHEKVKPEWAVHKRNSADLVHPTIPFVGKHYAEQPKKILVYASAENLADYWKGNDKKHWPGDWLDEYELAKNRHRRCFDDLELQKEKHGEIIPYVHCGPLEDGGLFIAALYIALKANLRSERLNGAREFYETVAFGNYGKYSIETELQKAIRTSPWLSEEEKKKLKKNLKRKNIDYAADPKYLGASREFIRADIEHLKPDYIILPAVKDNGFIDELAREKNITLIKINQINGCVVNNIAPNKRNHGCSKYPRRDSGQLPTIVKELHSAIKGVSKENYLYIFGHLDERLQAALAKKNV